MARHKDEDHIVFTSNRRKRNAVGACTLSSRALSERAFPAAALRNAQGRSSSFPSLISV
jgi:hypothetical protein